MAISVQIESRYKDFQLKIALQSEARRIGVLGASGSGKSMTLKAIAGIVTPQKGRIEIDGDVLFDSARHINRKTQKRNVGYMFQNYALFPTMTVRQNIRTGFRNKADATEETIRSMTERFQLSGLEDHLPSELSGGQQQRVALARIMAYDPGVILLDEPFSALDMYLKDRMQRELLEQLKEYNKTVIMVSHDRDEIYRFSEEVVIIDNGRVLIQGKTKDVFASPGTREAARLTGCKNFSAAERIDGHTVFAKDWGISLKTEKSLPDEVNWIGYRAHEFRTVWGERKENCIRFALESLVDLPFEQNYYVKPELDSFHSEQVLTWLVQREQWSILQEKGIPDYLQFREEDILFLQ